MSVPFATAPKGHWLMGNMREFQADALQFLLDNAKLGDVVRCRFGPFQLYIVNAPEGIHDVLVTDAAKYHKSRVTKTATKPVLGQGLFTNDGDFWKHQRKLVSPAFHTKRIANYAEIMVDFAELQASRWTDGQQLDVEAEMAEITMHIISKAGFDADVDGSEAELRDAVTRVLHAIDRQFDRLIPLPYWLPTKEIREFRAANTKLQAMIEKIIADRRAGRTGGQFDDKGDALSMLLMAQDENGAGMDDKQVRDEIMTLFGAGHETTAKALSWAWYVLGEYPDVAAKLRAELDSVLAGRRPTIEDLPKLLYLDQFVKEVLRLYPPAWVVTRDTIDDVTIAGVPVKKGTPIIINIYASHRNPALFPDPLTFKPERWTPDFEKSLPKSAYLPFGNGPRICIGASFSQMEAKLILAVLAQRFEMKLKPDHPVEPQDMFTLRPKYGLPMTVRERVREMA